MCCACAQEQLRALHAAVHTQRSLLAAADEEAADAAAASAAAADEEPSGDVDVLEHALRVIAAAGGDASLHYVVDDDGGIPEPLPFFPPGEYSDGEPYDDAMGRDEARNAAPAVED